MAIEALRSATSRRWALARLNIGLSKWVSNENLRVSGHLQEEFSVPAPLRTAVGGALQWMNEGRSTPFEVTGLVGEENALHASPGEPFELGLVLCDGDVCTHEQVRFKPVQGRYEFSFAETANLEVPPLLDPPPGMRTTWLDEQLRKHEFLLLLFYRGRW
jgi:hypothetical protein